MDKCLAEACQTRSACGAGARRADCSRASTSELLGLDGDLRDLGEHRLKGLTAPERIYQLGDREFPALRSLNRTNLPLVSGPLLGRDEEHREIRELVSDGARPIPPTRNTVFERRVWRVRAQIVEFKLEGDGDIHLVLFDRGAYMIAEMPSAACLTGTRDRPAIVAARSIFTRRCGAPTDSWQSLGAVAYISGGRLLGLSARTERRRSQLSGTAPRDRHPLHQRPLTGLGGESAPAGDSVRAEMSFRQDELKRLSELAIEKWLARPRTNSALPARHLLGPPTSRSWE